MAALVVVPVLVLASCASSDETSETASTVGTEPTIVTTSPTITGCADVVDAVIDASGNTYRVTASILSADIGWDKYADAWEVRAPDGTVLDTRILAHPHVDEQPFSRSLSDVEIPAAVKNVEIAARDSVVGFCGETVTVAVPGR